MRVPLSMNLWTGALVATILQFCLYSQVAAQTGKLWEAGRYSFSDELGGFEILGVSGTGIRDDPIVIRQRFATASAVTMVIRSAQAKTDSNSYSSITNGTIYLRLETANNSNLPWVGFGLELQEIFNKPSIYGDGLSFDQLGRRSADITSDRFLNFEDQFEPGDRLVYTNGVVDHRTKVTLNFLITDFTPVSKFYLHQDPMIPAS